ncbi:protein aardvark-like [Pomacea canaliculata]|uniref:protein aardvark-like n=1 Tax=Pomacea canaliculata TaxID=400727 RepID=UPI000D732BA4|nr:protein aardvark-like [Pomacea canaliculata]
MLVGGVHTIISMMNRFYDDCDILENGCRALGSFAFYDDTCVDVAQAGATETVLTAMTSDKSNMSVKDCGCWALACLTSTEKTCEEFVSLGGLHVLLRTLETFPREEQLQDYGVTVLCNISTLDSTLPCVSTHRVVAVLTSVCRTFPESVELLEKVMVAFGQIANTEEVYRSLLSDGGLRSIISVMTSLPENRCIQDNGCRIIGNMAVTEHLRKSTEQQGASQAVIAAILNMDSCVDILLCSCMALMNLTADITDNKMRAKTNGAVPTLLSTLRNFPGHPDITVAVLKTIGNLVDLEEVCRQLIDERGFDTIVDIGTCGQPSDDIRVFASRILCGFTSLPDLTEDQRGKTERTLVLLQSCSPDNPDIALSLCQGLRNLLKSGTLVTSGWLDVILSTMNHFRYEPEIHLSACRIIATIAFGGGRGSSEEAASLVGELAVTRVLQTLRTFPEEPELQLVGCAPFPASLNTWGTCVTWLSCAGGSMTSSLP